MVYSGVSGGEGGEGRGGEEREGRRREGRGGLSINVAEEALNPPLITPTDKCV